MQSTPRSSRTAAAGRIDALMCSASSSEGPLYAAVPGAYASVTQGHRSSFYDRDPKAEEMNRQDESAFRQIVDAIPHLIGVLSTDGRVLYANQSVLEYTGLTADEVQAADFRARIFHPDDVERLQEERQDALARGVPFELEQRTLRRDGQYRWFLWGTHPQVSLKMSRQRWRRVASKARSVSSKGAGRWLSSFTYSPDDRCAFPNWRELSRLRLKRCSFSSFASWSGTGLSRVPFIRRCRRKSNTV